METEMRISQSIALVLGLSVLAGGCGGDTRACKKGTLLVDVTLAEAADALDITVTTGSGQPISKSATLKSGTTKGTIEVDFPSGYPAGQPVTVSIIASSAGVAVGSGSTTQTLGAGCDHFEVAITGSGAGDMNAGVGDMTGEGDGGACVPACTTCGAGMITVCGMQLSCPCPVVSTLQNPFTTASDTVTIEGSGFVSGANVTFPGGVTAPATVISSQRLTATVPATAGNGVLTVNQNGSASNSVAFRRASFAVGVDPMRNYEQAEYGHLTPMITPRFGTSAVVGDKYVWVIGGFDSTTGNNIVEQALINADGTIGGFTATAPLVVGRYHQSAVRIGSWVYVLGGIAAGAASNKIERAPINSDGTLGTFVDAGTTLSTARFSFATAVVGGWLYAMGGVTGVKCSGPTTLASVERAPIAADGTVGAFADAGITLPDARSVFTTFVAGHTLYALGGTTLVAMSTIAADGTLGAFSAGGGASGADTVEFAFTAGGKLYEVGDFASTITASAPYTLDGTIGTFAPTTTAPGTGSNLLSYAVVGHYLYGFGGGREPGCGSPLSYAESGNTVRASLDAGGELVNFTTVASGGLNIARSAFGAVVLGNHVYAIGGQTDFTKPDVEVATVDGSGMLSPFSYQAGLSLVTQRSNFGTAIVDNRLYVVSGVDKNNAVLSSVEVAPIGVDGTLGAFTAAMAGATPVSISNARAGLRLIVVGTIVGVDTPQLCALGGGTTLEVDCVNINGDGTLAGSFAAVSGVNLVTARGDAPAVLLSGSQVTVSYGTSGIATMEQTTLNSTSQAFATAFASINTSEAFPGDGVAALMLGNHWVITGGHSNSGGVAGNHWTNAVVFSAVDPVSGAVALPATDANSVLVSFRSDHRVFAVENEIYSLGGAASGFPADFERSEMR